MTVAEVISGPWAFRVLATLSLMSISMASYSFFYFVCLFVGLFNELPVWFGTFLPVATSTGCNCIVQIMRATWCDCFQVIGLHSAAREWSKAIETLVVTSLQNIFSILASKQIVWAISVLYCTIWQLIVRTTTVLVQAAVIFHPCVYRIKTTSGVAVDTACTSFFNRSMQTCCHTMHMSNSQFQKCDITAFRYCRLLGYGIYLYKI